MAPVAYTVTFEGDEASITLDPERPVRDLIQHALVAFDVNESADACRLAGFKRVYHPTQALHEARVPAETPLDLRLPL